MADDRTIAQLEREHYYHIECRCRNQTCRHWVAVPFKMIREKRPGLKLEEMTIEGLGRKMPCGKCGGRDVEYKPMRQEDAPGYARRY